MRNYDKGKIFEDYIGYVYQFLLDLETGQDSTSISVSKNLTLRKGRNSAEFDVYYQFDKAGVTHKVVIECKNHSKPISLDYVRSFRAKLLDFPDLAGVFISNSGFQKGAIDYCKEHGILAMSSGELPSFFQLMALRLKQIFLPETTVKGEPFYILMEVKKGELSGSYHLSQYNSSEPSAFMLFLTRKQANEVVKATKEVHLEPRALRQESLGMIVNLAERLNAKFNVMLAKVDLPDQDYMSFYLEPSDLIRHYSE